VLLVPLVVLYQTLPAEAFDPITIPAPVQEITPVGSTSEENVVLAPVVTPRPSAAFGFGTYVISI